MAKSTKSAAALKPYNGFPLTAHRGAGQWCKKLRGKVYYFGPLSDWQGALKRYERDWPYRVQGLEPPVLADDEDACTLRVLCNLFLEAKRNRVASGELTDLSYRDYFRSCSRLVDYFGPLRRVDDLGPADFEAYRSKLATKFATSSLANEVGRCRVLFKFAADQRLIASPVHFGQSFDKPTAKAVRRHRNASDKLQFSRDELVDILAALAGEPVEVDGEPVTLKPDPQLRAMTLLGINCGLGVTDCGYLRTSHLDLSRAWLDYPRIKTETDRQAALWPETVEALETVLRSRRQPRSDEDADVVFLTRTRKRWVRTKPGETAEKNLHLNAISPAFGKILQSLHINGRRRLNFYTLRRTFEIVGGGCRDQVAVDLAMGHCDRSMASVYRQGIVDEQRMRDLADHVQFWLFGKEAGRARRKKAASR